MVLRRKTALFAGSVLAAAALIYAGFAVYYHRLYSRPNLTQMIAEAKSNPQPVEGGPQLAFGFEDPLDLGIVSSSEKTVKKFTIRNVGEEPLEIAQVSTECGCTKAEVDKKEIPAGEEAELSITVDPERISGFESEKRVIIVSNDTYERARKFFVRAAVEPEFVFEPETLDFGHFEKGIQPEGVLRIRQATDEPLEVKTVSAGTGSGLDVSYDLLPESEWSQPGRREYLVRVAVSDDVPPGPLNRRLAVETNAKRAGARKAAVAVLGEVEAFYEVTPRTAVLLRAAAGDENAALVKVRSDVPIAIENIETTGHRLLARVVEADSPEAQALRDAQAQASRAPDLAELPGAEAPKQWPHETLIRVSVTPDAVAGSLFEELSFDVAGEGKRYRQRLRVTGFVRSDDSAPALRVPVSGRRPAAAK